MSTGARILPGQRGLPEIGRDVPTRDWEAAFDVGPSDDEEMALFVFAIVVEPTRKADIEARLIKLASELGMGIYVIDAEVREDG